jgi:hypothetical protein
LVEERIHTSSHGLRQGIVTENPQPSLAPKAALHYQGLMILPLGTLVNVAAVLVGGAIGLILHDRLPKRVKEIVFQGLGLCTLVIGMKMALVVENPLLLIFSIVLGGMLGAALRLEHAFERLGDHLKKTVGSASGGFTDGLITAFLIFCIGSLTILGAIDEGLRGDPTLYYTKAVLDGFASIALAATYGVGVLFSVIPMFIYQFGLTLAAVPAQAFFTDFMIAQLTCTGGALILGIGINLLKLSRIPLSDFLPSLFISALLAAIFGPA